jgi:hypothetical protein
MTRTSLIVTVPVPVRDAVYAEAERRGTSPARVVEAVLRRYLPTFVGDALRETFSVGLGAESAGDR